MGQIPSMILLAFFSFIVGKNFSTGRPWAMEQTCFSLISLFIVFTFKLLSLHILILLFENFIMHSMCFGQIHCPIPPFLPFPSQFHVLFILSLLSLLSAASQFMSGRPSTRSWKQQRKRIRVSNLGHLFTYRSVSMQSFQTVKS